MKKQIRPGGVHGTVSIPASKSHTIRALLLAATAAGESTIDNWLASADTESCIDVLSQLGVRITKTAPDSCGATATLCVNGIGPHLNPSEAPLDCGNSGTTLYLSMGLAALQPRRVSFTGDEQLQRRSAEPLLAALEQGGVTVTRDNGSCVPFSLEGPFAAKGAGDGGGADPVRIEIACPTSQYLSALLLAAPLTERGLSITVPLLNERPYVDLTLGWLERHGVRFERGGYSHFTVPGGQAYRPMKVSIPGDYSSATFFAVAAAATGSTLTLAGLDPDDAQGDKEVLTILKQLGASVEQNEAGFTISGPSQLSGGDIDLNAMPDALPALAIAGSVCSSALRLINVPQARAKETDRIRVMREVVEALGGKADELAEGLIVYPGQLRGGVVDSYGDHRVAMAASIAGLVAQEPVTVTNADVATITFPGFYELLEACRDT
ncbi:MAG: 3-phosphoshikimate 1-carboxyvinyltransferase [Spirochaetales bacterium]